MVGNWEFSAGSRIPPGLRRDLGQAELASAIPVEVRNVFALDFGVIYDFLHSDDYLSSLVIRALTRLPDTEFTIPPGTVLQLVRFCTKYLQLPEFSHDPDLLRLIDTDWKLLRLADSTRGRRLGLRLAKLQRRAERGTYIVYRMQRIIDSPNRTEMAALDLDSARVRGMYDVLRRLFARVRSDAWTSNPDDSINLAMSWAAFEQDVELPLVSRTPAVQRVLRLVNRLDVHYQVEHPETRVVLSPFAAILLLAVRSGGERAARASSMMLHDLILQLDSLADRGETVMSNEVATNLNSLLGHACEAILGPPSRIIQESSASERLHQKSKSSESHLSKLAEKSRRSINEFRAAVKAMMDTAPQLFEYANLYSNMINSGGFDSRSLGRVTNPDDIPGANVKPLREL